MTNCTSGCKHCSPRPMLACRVHTLLTLWLQRRMEGCKASSENWQFNEGNTAQPEASLRTSLGLQLPYADAPNVLAGSVGSPLTSLELQDSMKGLDALRRKWLADGLNIIEPFQIVISKHIGSSNFGEVGRRAQGLHI